MIGKIRTYGSALKVAFVFLHPFSESMGSVVRVRELAFSLEKLGVEVYILTPYERSFDLSQKVHVVSTSVFLNAVGLSKTMYRLTKLAYYSKAFPKLFSKADLPSSQLVVRMIRGMAKLIREWGIDLVQVEQDVALPFGAGLKRLTGLPVVVDVHNVSSEELVATGVLQKDSEGFASLQKRTKELLDEIDQVVVVSEEMRNYVVKNYRLKPGDVSVVSPGGRCSIDKAVVERRVKPVKVVYAGLVAHRERVDLFVKSMPFIREYDANVTFYITNRGDAVKGIKKLAEKLYVEPVFFWYDNYRLVDKFLSTCHVGVLPSSNDRARRMGTPAKLFSYLSAGVPIVANDVGGWTEIIKHENVGLLTSDDPEEFGEAVSILARNPKLMQECAYNGLELIRRKYNWDNSACVLTRVYKELLS